MNSIIALILLQINLLGSTGEPMTNAMVYLQNASSGETIAHVKIGQNGKFRFSNLDPANYVIHLEIPESSVKRIDKKSREKYDTNIEVAFNTNKNIYCWQRNDGYITFEIIEKSKIADALIPNYAEIELNEQPSESNINSNDKKILVNVMQFTVIGKYGSIGGLLTSVSQREFYNLTVGTKDISLEDSGGVKVIKRYNAQ